MSRGHYGGARTSIGARFVHVVELKQRYDQVKTVAVQSLLQQLSREGRVTSLGGNRWEVALPDGAWVQLTWYADASTLDVTITDRAQRTLDQSSDLRQRYEAILSRVSATLMPYGVTIVGRAMPQVGLTLYHSVGDRAEAVKQMALDWTALYQNLASQVGEITPDRNSPSGFHLTTQAELDAHPPNTSQLVWWKTYAKPLFNQWVAFRREQLGGDQTVAADYLAFAERFATNWDVYEEWQEKLAALRASAQKLFRVSAPAPTELPKTLWGHLLDLGKDAKNAAAGAGNFVKYAAYGALGLGALVAVSSLVSNLKSGTDPAEKYMEIYRSRAARSRRALPAREQLLLAEGE